MVMYRMNTFCFSKSRNIKKKIKSKIVNKRNTGVFAKIRHPNVLHNTRRVNYKLELVCNWSHLKKLCRVIWVYGLVIDYFPCRFILILNMSFDCAWFLFLCILNPTCCASNRPWLCNFSFEGATYMLSTLT